MFPVAVSFVTVEEKKQCELLLASDRSSTLREMRDII